ncbi:MAG: AAA family ATPase [Ktedonobacteraceae bacterium]|nr:AAA family ATPase [Ktedonobacteraceae bacterium]
MQAPFADPFIQLERLRPALPLVGRDVEMQLVQLLLHTVAFDAPQGARSLVITGEMGMGKTRLLAALCEEARQADFHIVKASAYESGSKFPYFPFIEALRPFLRSLTREELRRCIGMNAPPDASVAETITAAIMRVPGTSLVATLAYLFPELLMALSKEEQAQAVQTEVFSPEQEKFRLFEAIATLLERIASAQPMILALDNLQWADSASLELTLYLTVRLHKSRVALVGVTRPAGLSGGQQRDGDDVPVTTVANNAATQALTDLMRNGLLYLLPLGPLSLDAATEYLQELLPGTIPQSVTQMVLARADGNPFFLEELVRTLTLNQQLVQRDGVWKMAAVSSINVPDSIVLAVKQRLEGLSRACRAFVQVAALSGRIFLIDALVAVLEKSTGEMQALLDEAVKSSVIAQFTDQSEGQEEDDIVLLGYTQPMRYIFCQGVVYEVLQAEVPAYQARLLHAALGKALEVLYGLKASEHAAELAHHHALGGEKEATIRWSLLAGENAARQQAYREAIGSYRRVLKLLEANGDSNAISGSAHPTRAELCIIIGELWFKLGELEQATNMFQQALAELQKQPQEASFLLIARTNRLLADAYRIQARYEQALAHLQAARSVFDKEVAYGRSSSERLSVSWLPGRSFPTHREMDLEQNRISERIQFLQAQAMLEILLNHAAAAEPVLWQAHQLATEIGDRSSQAFALQIMSWVRGWGEHIHETIRLQKQALELYLAIGDPFHAALVEQGLGIIHQAIGEMEQASLYTQHGLERAHRYGVRGVIGWLYWNQGVMALCQGHWGSSEEYLQQALQEALDADNARLKATTMQAQAELQFRRGNWSEAEHLFQNAIIAATSTDWLPSTIALYGHFLAVTGRRGQARTQLVHASEHPEPSGFSGDFYIPFLAEGFLHLDMPEQAAIFIERIQKQRGCMYYGNAVDRILGVVAAHMGNWAIAEQAFEEALKLCQRTHNQPEEAAILYEQARMALMRHAPLHDIEELCARARALFLQYEMQRAVTMIDVLREGAEKLIQAEEKPEYVVERMPHAGIARGVVQEQPAEYELVLTLTKRELEVLRLVAEGHLDREVAEALVISPRTVNRHLSNIFVKLAVPGRAAAVAYAIRQGLV